MAQNRHHLPYHANARQRGSIVDRDIQELKRISAENRRVPERAPTFDEIVQQIVSRVKASAEVAAKQGRNDAECPCWEIVWKPYKCGTLLDFWQTLRGTGQEHINRHYADAENVLGPANAAIKILRASGFSSVTPYAYEGDSYLWVSW
jgi:hypothetical protein